jgi:sarcosine oxidase subunit gamma
MPEAVRIATAPPACRFIFRGSDAVAAAGGAFGVELPRTPLRAASAGTRHALWLGPDEWLLLGPQKDRTGTEQAFGAIAERHSLVDVSHRNVGLLVEGRAAELVLNSGCPLDLDPTAFPVGMCTRTVFDKAEIVLWRTGEQAFQVEVWRSFAPYVEALLREAAVEVGA